VKLTAILAQKEVTMKKTAVLALGGNAIIKAGEKGTITEQFKNTRDSLVES
jgi:hypothetical protein